LASCAVLVAVPVLLVMPAVSISFVRMTRSLS
jgi:hypothetical protein